MPSIFDEYLKQDIMDSCESFFNNYLQEEGVPDEGLTDKERKLVDEQVGYLLDMINRIYRKYPKEEHEERVIDKLIGMCVVCKMNEARLCRLLNKYIDDGDE